MGEHQLQLKTAQHFLGLCIYKVGSELFIVPNSKADWVLSARKQRKIGCGLGPQGALNKGNRGEETLWWEDAALADRDVPRAGLAQSPSEGCDLRKCGA